VFNVGAGAFRSSALLCKLNARDHRGAADELLRWNRASGQVLPGLDRRRRAERALFLSPPVAADVLTEHKRRLMTEYDGLRLARRRRALRDAMLAQRRRIWHAAQASGWAHGGVHTLDELAVSPNWARDAGFAPTAA
jgi:Phage lysozyme